MKIKLLILIQAFVLTVAASAQWVQRAAFPGVARAKATSFTIGNKIYVMGGVTNASLILNDFWEYDIPANSWLHKPNFPGPERYGGASFVINNKGYISTGGNDFGNLYDLWEYDPSTSNWIQKADLPNGQAQHENQRTEAFAFSIGNKGYLGGGTGWVFGANSTLSTAFFDLWEYNPGNNSWTSKSGIPDFIGRNMSIAVAINNKAYVGLGCDVNQTTYRKSMWEYDPVLDSWTAKANFPTTSTTDCAAFTLDSALYVLGGVNLSPLAVSSQFFKYDPVLDSWTQLSNFNGGSIVGEFAVSNGSSAFAGTGYNGSLNTRTDFWEFTSATTGINEAITDAENGLIVYPNPAREYLSVQSKKTISSLEIFDVTGKLLITEKTTFTNIDVRDFPGGLYNLRVKFVDGAVVNRRVLFIF